MTGLGTAGKSIGSMASLRTLEFAAKIISQRPSSTRNIPTCRRTTTKSDRRTVQLRLLGFVRRHGHGQETRGAPPTQVSSVSGSFLLQPDGQRLGRLDLFVKNDGPVRMIAGLSMSRQCQPKCCPWRGTAKFELATLVQSVFHPPRTPCKQAVGSWSQTSKPISA